VSHSGAGFARGRLGDREVRSTRPIQRPPQPAVDSGGTTAAGHLAGQRGACRGRRFPTRSSPPARGMTRAEPPRDGDGRRTAQNEVLLPPHADRGSDRKGARSTLTPGLAAVLFVLVLMVITAILAWPTATTLQGTPYREEPAFRLWALVAASAMLVCSSCPHDSGVSGGRGSRTSAARCDGRRRCSTSRWRWPSAWYCGHFSQHPRLCPSRWRCDGGCC
jgi:hypothetical protein